MEESLRMAAFDWIKEQSFLNEDVISYAMLLKGFKIGNYQITLAGPKGIWKPKFFQYPISIRTSVDGPYPDSFKPGGLLDYKYRGTDPYHPDNVGLREMIKYKIPLIYFLGVVKGKYIAAWPVYIVRDNVKDLSFSVAVDDIRSITKENDGISMSEEPAEIYYRREYITSTIKIRLHQKSFRERVLSAYRNQCSLCQLKHRELLDAAHIISDNSEGGDPFVTNGISLCKIHHAAFDKNILGITPEYVIKVRKDVLIEIDGPMLKYGLQSLNNQRIILPNKAKDWPDKERLESRYKRFLEF